ncbi:hypothetical protein FA15DRAFT_706622 [Coprinopsis marcescibilis]|uniref:F-box domain-containing protein n=1 Tax=Coprinopsis marcescibilis TaxID=230819 RepID=A0A5C3KNS5_COPMA|nr:hypothetical protein FA15DRAFT_706622 [Coprinopsis marcescibilis]
MSDSLPPELWDNIIKYLSSPTIIGLMSVNRRFMSYALDEKYRKFKLAGQIGLHSDWLYWKILETVKTADNAPRVRYLILDTWRLSKETKIWEFCKEQNREHTLMSSEDQRLLAPYPAESITSMLADVLPRLTNVTKILLRDHPVAVSHPLLPITWSQFSRLQSLELAICLGTAKNSLPPLGVEFPELSKLTIRVNYHCAGCSVGFYNLMSSTSQPGLAAEEISAFMKNVAAFINQFKNTLTQLVLSSPSLESGDLYSGMGHFPHLASFDAGQGVSAFCKGEDSFLARNRGTIRHLSCDVLALQPEVGGVKMEQVETLTLKQHAGSAGIMAQHADIIRRLSCDVLSPRNGLGGRTMFFRSMFSTIRVLRMDREGSSLEDEDVLDFLRAVAHFGMLQPNQVETLVISIRKLTPDLLLAVARAFPALRTLDIRSSLQVDVGSQLEGAPNGCGAFAQGLRAAFATERWCLFDISLSIGGYHDSMNRRLTLWEVMLLCAQCIPSIESFNGQGNKALPQAILDEINA